MLEGLQSESLKKFMNEIASEIGVENYTEVDKSRLAAIIHGTVGGNSSRLLNELGQKIITETPPEEVRDLMNKYDLHVPEEVINKLRG